MASARAEKSETIATSAARLQNSSSTTSHTSPSSGVMSFEEEPM